MPATCGSSAATGAQIAAIEVTQNWSHADAWPSSPGQSWQSGMPPSIFAIDIFRDMSVEAAARAAVPAAKAARKTTARMRTSVRIGQTVVLPLHRVQIRMVAGDGIIAPPHALYTSVGNRFRQPSREWQQTCPALAWQITSLKSKVMPHGLLIVLNTVVELTERTGSCGRLAMCQASVRRN
jgi:hypothetical protein